MIFQDRQTRFLTCFPGRADKTVTARMQHGKSDGHPREETIGSSHETRGGQKKNWFLIHPVLRMGDIYRFRIHVKPVKGRRKPKPIPMTQIFKIISTRK